MRAVYFISDWNVLLRWLQSVSAFEVERLVEVCLIQNGLGLDDWIRASCFVEIVYSRATPEIIPTANAKSSLGEP